MIGPRFGDRVRVRCGATGRYLHDDLALVVSAQDNGLFIDHVDPDGNPHPTLPVPSDEELNAAVVALWYARSTKAKPVAEVTRWRVVLPFAVMKGIGEEDARRLAADHGGTVFRQTVRLYRDGREELCPWTPADADR